MSSSVMPATVVSQPSNDQIPQSSTGALPNAQLSEGNFLQLLTAQLENQDPLNPMSASDFAAELAQFSTAVGVQQMSATQTQYGNLQLAGLVGHNVAVNGNTVILQNKSASGAYGLSGAASDVIVTVTDAAGNTLQTLNLGAAAAGTQTFTWNGIEASGSTAPAGTYTFNVAAVGAANTTITATPFALVPVTGVSLGGSAGPMVDLGGGLSPVGLGNIYQIF